MSPLSDDDLAHLRSVLPEESRYRLIEAIGHGGMGVVWRAHDTRLGRDVALKVLAAHQPGPDAEARLDREASILARLEHPGIVPVHDSGRLEDGRLYYVMKLVQGRLLSAALDEGASPGQRVDVLIRIAEAVAFAHRAGVIHRDLKPSNIMVGEFGEVLVLDWGMAGWLGERSGDDTVPSVSVDAARAVPTDERGGAPPTATGTVLGTPGWMSPEQSRGQRTDARSDIWGLGALLSWSFGGGPTTLGSDGQPEPTPALPRPLRSIARRAQAVDPAARYADADAFLADLRAWRDGDRVMAHRESALERVGRFVSRYRVPILLIGAYLLVRVAIYVWGRI
ncbi:MAG TPA: serine/threonine-protein kinase [Candidatus Eisenbacteria bacterium]